MVRPASYFDRLNSLSTNLWTLRRNGLKRAATESVEAATERGESLGSYDPRRVALPKKTAAIRATTTP